LDGAKLTGSNWTGACERDFFIDNLLVRLHYIIVMIRWTGLAPWEFEFPFSGSLTSTFLQAVLDGAKLTGSNWTGANLSSISAVGASYLPYSKCAAVPRRARI